jgi:hypothetical protein
MIHMVEFKKPYINESLVKSFILQNLVLSEHYVQNHNYLDYEWKQVLLGCRLLKDEIPKALEACSMPVDDLFRALSEDHPVLWNRLYGPAAFGYTQGELLFELKKGDVDLRQEAAKIASIFNLGISIFDYILDETPAGSRVFDDVTVGFLQDLMDLSKAPSSAVIARRMDSYGSLERILFALIIAFFRACRCLYQQKRNTRAWNDLSLFILKMYNAEQKCFGLKTDEIIYDTQQLSDLKCKSALPTTISLICEMFFDEDREQSPSIEHICDTLSSIFWLADDLSDLVKDLNTGVPNCALSNMKLFQVEESGNHHKWHLREAINLTMKHLFSLLNKLNEDLYSIPIHEKIRRDVLEFARFSVNVWLTDSCAIR